MHSAGSKLLFTATDLSNFLACEHLSLLDRRAALGGPRPPVFPDPGLDVLRQRGLEHEQQYLNRRRATGSLHGVEIEAQRGPPGMISSQGAAPPSARPPGVSRRPDGAAFTASCRRACPVAAC